MLKINKIILDNFCQHEHRELSFPSGLTGVFGRNGAGKTNIANAIYSALTGIFNRHTEGATGCIRQGQDSAFIEVHGELLNQHFRLRRDIFPSKLKHTLWLDGQKYSDKAKDIELWITETSGLTPQMMSEFVFIGQSELYAFLDANDAERSKKFAALCNTKIYERLRDEYGEMLKIDRTRSEAISDTSIDLLKQNIASIKTNLSDLNRIAKEIKSEIDSMPETKEVLEDYIQEQRKILENIDKYETALSEFNERQTEVDKQQEQVNQCSHNVTKTKEKLEALRNELREELNGKDYETFINDLKDLQRVETERESLIQQIKQTKQTEQNLPQLEKPSQDVIDELTKSIDEMQTAITELSQELRDKSVLIDTMDRLGDNAENVCPLCGSLPEYWSVNLSSLKEEYNQKTKEKSQTTAKLKDYEQQIATEIKNQRKYSDTQSKRQILLQQIEKLEESYSQLPEQDLTLSQISAQLNKISGIASEGRIAKTNAQHAEQTLTRELEQLEKSQQNWNKAVVALNQLKPKSSGDFSEQSGREAARVRAKNQITKYKTCIDEINSLSRELLENQGSIQEATRQLKDMERKLKEQEALLLDSSKTKQWFESCERAITWFKKDGLPRLIHRSILRQLSAIINAELEQYDKPFVVEVNDDLTFTAQFADGRNINSRALSGGQKVMLALAFLSAINQTFMQNIGIMVWDEPTNSLDPINSEFLYSILERKKKLLHQRGQQLIIITFDEGMIPVFDSIYHVDNPNNNEPKD